MQSSDSEGVLPVYCTYVTEPTYNAFVWGERDNFMRKVLKVEIALPSNVSVNDIKPYVSKNGRKLIVEFSNQDALFDDRRVLDKNYGHIVSAEQTLSAFRKAKLQVPEMGKNLLSRQIVVLPYKVEKQLYKDGPYPTGWALHFLGSFDPLLSQNHHRQGYLYVHLLKKGEKVRDSSDANAVVQCYGV
jgi:hypothetical protein